MDILALQQELDNISIVLYQNKEQEGIELVSRFLGKLQMITDELFQEIMEKDVHISSCIAELYQEMYNGYQHKDMLGMADCLQEYALLVTEIYRQVH